MNEARAIVGYAMRESLRRRVFLVLALLSVAFLVLYGLGASAGFHDVSGFQDPENPTGDLHDLAGATMFGLSMFATLFLANVLAIFLTLGVVRGDAERGLLQPLVVRPIGRSQLLLARFAGAAGVSAAYVLVLYAGSLIITNAVGGWTPDRIVGPGLGLAAAVVIVSGLSLLGSVFLSTTANGIAVFMLFGAGLTAGLLGQIGEALASNTLQDVSRIASWALPFEALYQSGLDQLTADTGGVSGALIDLGPFGGAQSASPWLWPYAIAYLAAVLWLGTWAFGRRDL